MEADGIRSTGLRATPTVAIGHGASQLGAAVPAFWQNFPRTLRATPSEICVSFLPAESGRIHELQGGEQKTHECYVCVETTASPRRPSNGALARVSTPSPIGMWSLQALRDFVTGAEDDAVYRSLVDAAIDGIRHVPSQTGSG